MKSISFCRTQLYLDFLFKFVKVRASNNGTIAVVYTRFRGWLGGGPRSNVGVLVLHWRNQKFSLFKLEHYQKKLKILKNLRTCYAYFKGNIAIF